MKWLHQRVRSKHPALNRAHLLVEDGVLLAQASHSQIRS